ncbi:hypothetical protein [Kineothrix sedimenti]|uniref:HK97 gp10 family phage protein n=1 Tax=Kineothrix sedimenti TaxID=3123317 RepID=A0ABZ3F116_9FIRM
MAKVFRTTIDLQKYMEKACEKAIENACNRLLGTLQEFIDSEYYDKYEPEYYRRTYQFWKSATTKMLNKTSGEIFMDENAMNYGAYWDGETQLYMADAGYHGSAYIYEDGHFFKRFVEYCEENALKILKEELRKQGLNVK